MENWDDYRLILSLHRGKTLRNAAQSLALNHSTVSRRLATLNHKYGTQVFESTAKGYNLTPLGSKLLSTALKIEFDIPTSLNEYSNIMAADKIVANGFAISFPVACGYEP